MKRRGFLKMLGIGAAVPAVAMPAVEPDIKGEGYRILCEAIAAQERLNVRAEYIGPQIYPPIVIDPADWYDAQGNQQRVSYDMTATGSCELMDWSQLRSEFDKGSKEQS